MVEIAPDANPPVVKIIDYKKFKYLEEKKQKEARKHTKETELKEVRFSPFIGEHDLETGLKKVRKFLSEGDIVKITIVFKGRQMAHQEFGPKVLEKILAQLGDLAQKDREARFEGRRFTTVIRPGKVIQKPKEQSENKQTPEQNKSEDKKYEGKNQKSSS